MTQKCIGIRSFSEVYIHIMIVYLLLSRYDLNNVEKDVKHRIIIILHLFMFL